LIHKAFRLLATALFSCTLVAAHAQSSTSTPDTPFEKQLKRFDLGVSGAGIFNTTVSGPILKPAAPDCEPNASGVCQNVVTQFGSNTFGAVATLRYIVKPYIGLEFNYGYARYTENYSVAPGQIQTKVNEYTFGYIATPPHPIFGLQPYIGAGAGTQAFKPTPHGGQGAPEKARATYYYTLGVQKELGQNGHFGIRAGFRELFFLDPDFGQNYLTILKHANTYEPQAGFYLRY
jgi:hypothetical protein